MRKKAYFKKVAAVTLASAMVVTSVVMPSGERVTVLADPVDDTVATDVPTITTDGTNITNAIKSEGYGWWNGSNANTDELESTFPASGKAVQYIFTAASEGCGLFLESSVDGKFLSMNVQNNTWGGAAEEVTYPDGVLIDFVKNHTYTVTLSNESSKIKLELIDLDDSTIKHTMEGTIAKKENSDEDIDIVGKPLTWKAQAGTFYTAGPFTEKHNFVLSKNTTTCTIAGEKVYTCQDENCNYSYSYNGFADHSLVYHLGEENECGTKEVSKGYWSCNTCNQNFTDSECGTVITDLESLKIDEGQDTTTWEIKETGWWTDWSEGYQVKDGEMLEFKLHVKGGENIWNTMNAFFVNAATQAHVAPKTVSGYKEYAGVRADDWDNVGGGSNVPGIIYSGTAATIDMLKDADVVATIARNKKEVTYTYYVYGEEEKVVASRTTVIDLSATTNKMTSDTDDLYVFFIGDTSTVTVQKAHTWDFSDKSKYTSVTTEINTHGQKEYTTYTCLTCNHNLMADYEDSHTWGNPTTTDATCTADGKSVYTCTEEECDAAKTEIIPKHHTLGTLVPRKEATCTADGNLAYYHCSVCNKYFSDENAENKLSDDERILKSPGHKWGDATYIKDGKELTQAEFDALKCNETAYLTGVCSVCQETKNNEAVTGGVHTFDIEHSEITTAATCMETGIRTYTCTACQKEGNTKTEKVDKIAHNLVHKPAVAATKEQAGNREYWECSMCHDYYSSSTASTDTLIADKESVKIAYHETPALIQNMGFDGSLAETDESYVDGSITYTNAGASIVPNPDDPDDKVLYLKGDGTATGETYIISSAGAFKDYDFSEGITISMNMRPTKQFKDWNYFFGLGVLETDETNYIDGTIGFIARYGNPYKALFPGDGWIEGNIVGSAYDYFLKEDNADKWYNLTYVFAKDSVTIYVNGKAVVAHTGQKNLETILKKLNSEKGQLRIGKGIDTNLEGFTGYIDDVMIYTSTLQAAEVENVASHEKGHILGDKVAATVTCTEAGNVEHYQCKVCNKYFADAEAKTELTTIASEALQHSYGADTAYTDASGNPLTKDQVAALKCNEIAYVTGTCTRCHAISQGDEVVGTNHTYGVPVITKATPDKDGEITETCSVCDATATGHEKKTVIKKASDITLAGTSFEYTGEEIKPAVTVKDSDGKEIPAANYDVTYKDHKEAGTATVTVTFKGDTYSGSVEKKFTITEKQGGQKPGDGDKKPDDGDKKPGDDTDDKIPAASLTLSKTTVTLYTGKVSKTVTIKPTVTGASKTVTWKTSNPKVATVKNGKITAVGKGTATITATANGISKTVKVTVKNPTLTIKKGSKKFTKSKLTVKRKQKAVLTVTVSPKNSGISIAKLTAKQKKIASVTLKKGKITIKGKKKGSFTLQIKSGKTTKKIKLTVK